MKSRIFGLAGLVLALVLGCNSPEPQPQTVPTGIEKSVHVVPNNRYALTSNTQFSLKWNTAAWTELGDFRLDGTGIPAVVSMGDCQIRLTPALGKVINLDGDLTPYKGEKVCGGSWAYSDNVTVKVTDHLFPSDITDSTTVVRRYEIGEVVFTDTTLVPITALDPSREWRVVAYYESKSALTVAAVETLAPGKDLPMEKLSSYFGSVAQGMEVLGQSISSDNELINKVRSISNSWQWAAAAYSGIAPANQRPAAHAIAVAAAPLARFIDRGLLDRYLLNLTWEDMVATDPTIEYWPHHDPNAVVAHWGMSRNDHDMRLWWGRRGRIFFEETQKEVRSQVAAS